MKVEAYRCDNCAGLFDRDGSVGIGSTEDLYDPLRSFPAILDPSRADFHHCTECYHSFVLVPASVIDRAKDENGYNEKVAELYYILRKSTILKAARASRKK